MSARENTGQATSERRFLHFDRPGHISDEFLWSFARSSGAAGQFKVAVEVMRRLR